MTVIVEESNFIVDHDDPLVRYCAQCAYEAEVAGQEGDPADLIEQVEDAMWDLSGPTDIECARCGAILAHWL